MENVTRKINLMSKNQNLNSIIKNYFPEIIEQSRTSLGGFVRLSNVSARWSKQNFEETLKNIDIIFPSQKLTSIIGSVGSGKVRFCTINE